MSVNGTVQKTINLGGITFNQTATPTGDGMVAHSVVVPVATAGSLSARTDDNMGVVDVSDSGHSFIQTDRVDLYWTGGSRRGVSVSSVSGSLISIDGGAGDVLPAESSDVQITKPKLLDAAITGDNVKAIFFHTSLLGQITLVDSVDAELMSKKVGVNAVYDWEENNGEVNPIAGDTVAGIYLSNSSTTVEATMKVGIVYTN